MKHFCEMLRKREIGDRRGANLWKDIFEVNRSDYLYQRDIKGHTGCVNAVEFSSDENYIVSGGDDCSVRMWATVHCCVASDPTPVCSMAARHYSNIFALQFSHRTERIYSAGNDQRLFVHDIRTRKRLLTYTANGAYYRISAHPTNDDVVAASSDDKTVYIYDFREPEGKPSVQLAMGGTAYAAAYNPVNAYLLAVCSNPDGLTVYDMRNPKTTYAKAGVFTRHVICAAWHPNGDTLSCIRSRGSPLYFNLRTSAYVELKDSEYSNLCTTKTNAFAGSDYMVTGSDDWNIYVWRTPRDWENIPESETQQAYTVLKGHRSIVNHVRYSERNNLLISSGVEKIIKCWGPFEMQGSYQNPVRRVQMPRMRRYNGFQMQEVEEDWDTLQQFDAYYQQAVNGQVAFFASNDSDNEENMIYLHVMSDEDFYQEEMSDILSGETTDVASDDDDDDDINNELIDEVEEVETEATAQS